MNNVELYCCYSLNLRNYLNEKFSFDFIKVEKVEEDVDVKKILFRLLDGQKIEAVLMYHDYDY